MADEKKGKISTATNSGKIVGLDGAPIDKDELNKPKHAPKARRTPIIDWRGRSITLRPVPIAEWNETEPSASGAALDVLFQTQDQIQLVLAAMVMLASDMYIRDPDGPQEFYQFMQDTGMQIVDFQGVKTRISDELKQVFDRAAVAKKAAKDLSLQDATPNGP